MRQEPSLDLNSSGSGGVFMARKIERPYRRDDDKSHLKCTHCGGTRHTKNECFKLVGYPEWWPDAKRRGERKPARFSEQNRTGQVAMGWSTEGHTPIDEAEKKRENVPEKPSVNQMKKVPEATKKEFLSPSDPA